MNTHVTYAQLVHTLNECDEHYSEIPLDGGARIIVTQRGGRIFGPFAAGDQAESLHWINPALASPMAFAEFKTSGQWNMGGERLWIAPEIQYIIQDRTGFWGTHRLPPTMDPGEYELAAQGDGVTLQQRVSLQAFNTASGNKELAITRRINSTPDPLSLSSVSIDQTGFTYCGYEQTVTLTQLDTNAAHSEVWVLSQLKPGGSLIIPIVDKVLAAEYFGSAAPDALQIEHKGGARHLRIAITGDRQYKVGYKAVSMTGRLGYFNRLDDSHAYLLVRQFFNNPGAVYSEEPPAQPGEHGFSVHVYNDGGQLGGFGEMECNSRSIGGRTGLNTTTDSFYLWTYMGELNAVQRVATALLGVEL